MRLALLLFIGLMVGSAAQAAETTTPDTFSVQGVAVDVLASDATRAREVGFVEAQRRAWRQLWVRLTGKPESSAPQPGDWKLSKMVAGIDVDSERFSSRRYIARLTVDFDPIPVRAFIGQMGIGPGGKKSYPILLLPVVKDGGALAGVDPTSGWFQAWTTFGDMRSAIDYVRATGTTGDTVFLNPHRGGRQNLDLLRLALMRYGAEDLAVAEAKLDRRYPGGPVVGDFRIYFGPSRVLIGQARLVASNPAEVGSMLDQAVAQLDQAMNKAYDAGKLKKTKVIDFSQITASAPVEPEPTIGVQSFRGIDVLVETPNSSGWAALEQRLRAIPSVNGLTLTALSLGGTSQVRISYGTSLDWLRYDLDQAGIRLVSLADGRWTIRPKRQGDPSVPRPADVEGVGIEEGTVPNDTNGAPTTPAAPATPSLPPAAPPANGPQSLLPPAMGRAGPQERSQ